MAKPDPVDFLGLDALLSDDERALRRRVREFVAARVLPDVEDWYERGHFPADLAPEIGKLGLLGMHLAGAGGRSSVDYGVTCLELEAGDSGLRSFVSVQGSLAMFPIDRFGSEEQKARWLPAMAAGEVVGCFGLTEPEAGSNPSQMRTAARRDGGDWVLDGVKRWSTNGTIAGIAVIWARTDDGVRGFLVPTDTRGFEAVPIEPKHSLRMSASSELHLDGCRLPDDAVLPDVVGLRGPLACLNEARFGVLWGAIGAARTCYEAALERSRQREQFGRPIGAFQLTQAKLVDMLAELVKGTLLALRIGRLKDEGTLHPSQVSLGKLNNVREALAICREARSILAAEGITTNYPVMRHMANLESVLTYEGTSEMHTLIVGEAITGLRAYT